MSIKSTKPDIARGLGDATRLAILDALLDGERSVGELVERLGLSQPKVSNHLAVLRAAGLVRSERAQRRVLNRLAGDAVLTLAQAVRALVPAEAPQRPLALVADPLVEGERIPRRPAPALELAPPPLGERELVVFVLGGGEYALPIGSVREIVRFTRPRPLPGTRPGVLGIVQVHNRLLEAVDVRGALGLPDDAPLAELMVAEADGRAVALPVEAVREVVTVPPQHLLPPPVASDELDVVAAIGDRLVLVLRPAAVVGTA